MHLSRPTSSPPFTPHLTIAFLITDISSQVAAAAEENPAEAEAAEAARAPHPTPTQAALRNSVLEHHARSAVEDTTAVERRRHMLRARIRQRVFLQEP